MSKLSSVLNWFRIALASGTTFIPSAAWGRSVALATAMLLAMGLLPAGPSLAAGEAATAPVAQTVNINEADAAALAGALTGVGHSRAEEIIRYREAYGPFKTVEELTDVKGIGKSTLEKNRALITLE
jgi:competence protein ComEA